MSYQVIGVDTGKVYASVEHHSDASRFIDSMFGFASDTVAANKGRGRNTHLSIPEALHIKLIEE